MADGDEEREGQAADTIFERVVREIVDEPLRAVQDRVSDELSQAVKSLERDHFRLTDQLKLIRRGPGGKEYALHDIAVALAAYSSGIDEILTRLETTISAETARAAELETRLEEAISVEASASRTNSALATKAAVARHAEVLKAHEILIAKIDSLAEQVVADSDSSNLKLTAHQEQHAKLVREVVVLRGLVIAVLVIALVLGGAGVAIHLLSG